MRDSTSKALVVSPFDYVPGSPTEHFYGIDFDLLAQAVGECLPGYLPGIRVQSEKVPDGRVIFRLEHPILGLVGTVRVRKIKPNETALILNNPRDADERIAVVRRLYDMHLQGRPNIAIKEERSIAQIQETIKRIFLQTGEQISAIREASLFGKIEKALEEERKRVFWGGIIPGLYDRLSREELFEMSLSPGNETSELPQLIKPMLGAPLAHWFIYRRARIKQGAKYTLKELASDACLSHGHVRTEHANWKRKG